MTDRPGFLKPRVLESSEERISQINYRYYFYLSATVHSFLVLFGGLVFITAFYAQLLSIGVTSGSGGTPLTAFIRFILAVIFSVMAIWLAKGVRKFEDISYFVGGINMDQDDPEWPGDWVYLIGALVVSVGGFWIALQLSENTAQVALQTSFDQLINQGNVLDFIGRLLSYLALAGALGVFVSSLGLVRYGAYPGLKGLHAWGRRLWFALNVYFSPEDLDLALQDRCEQCCSATRKTRTTDDGIAIYCSFCGLKLSDCLNEDVTSESTDSTPIGEEAPT